MRQLSTLAFIVAVLGACTQLGGPVVPSAGSPSLPTDTQRPPLITIPPSMSLPTELGEVPAEIFEQAAEEAAAVANVAIDQVSIVRAERVTWSDGSLGCPEPGQMYTQALVPGFWLVLQAGDDEFDFHASERGEVKLCPRGQGVPPVEDR
jgi:hypothetical protein